MTLSIRGTINTTLAGEGVNVEDYSSHIGNVGMALVEREWAITDELKAVALRETEFNEEQLDELFGQVGLQVRPKPEPVIEVEQPAADLTADERITKLEQGQAQIVEALGTLTQLAQKHLGTSAL